MINKALIFLLGIFIFSCSRELANEGKIKLEQRPLPFYQTLTKYIAIEPNTRHQICIQTNFHNMKEYRTKIESSELPIPNDGKFGLFRRLEPIRPEVQTKSLTYGWFSSLEEAEFFKSKLFETQIMIEGDTAYTISENNTGRLKMKYISDSQYLRFYKDTVLNYMQQN